MTSESGLAPGVPPDYYRRIREVEEQHWWFRGMREISRALLGSRLADARAVLDAGCGTGGYLRWLVANGSVSRAAGIDIASAAIDFAHERVPSAELHVGALTHVPFDDDAFDLVVSNDVLQHVDEPEIEQSLRELGRVLTPGGTLLLRTNGSAVLRRERSDWRAYDKATLRQQLEQAGFEVERVTYANMIPSLWGRMRGRVLHAPSEHSHGIPAPDPPVRAAVGAALLRLEAAVLSRPGVSLPYGHTLFAVARHR